MSAEHEINADIIDANVLFESADKQIASLLVIFCWDVLSVSASDMHFDNTAGERKCIYSYLNLFANKI